MKFNAKVRTCLWFDNNGEEAARFYVSLLPDSFIENVVQPDPDRPPLVVEFTIAGAPMMVLNGGPRFTLSEAASISVLTEDQAETDTLWDALTARRRGGMHVWLAEGQVWRVMADRAASVAAHACLGRHGRGRANLGRHDADEEDRYSCASGSVWQ